MHYQEFKDKIKKFRHKVLMIPGNWDTTMFKKMFRKYNIHKKGKRINGVKIAGYGGADVIPKMLLATKTMDYSGEEFNKYLRKHKPHLMVSHMPPKGTADGKYKSANSIESENHSAANQPRAGDADHHRLIT